MTGEKCKKIASCSTFLYLSCKVITLCIPFLDYTLAWFMKLLFLNMSLWILYDYYFEMRREARIKG